MSLEPFIYLKRVGQRESSIVHALVPSSDGGNTARAGPGHLGARNPKWAPGSGLAQPRLLWPFGK